MSIFITEIIWGSESGHKGNLLCLQSPAFGVIHTLPSLRTSWGYKTAYVYTKILIKKICFSFCSWCLIYSSSFSNKLGFLHSGYVKSSPMEKPGCAQWLCTTPLSYRVSKILKGWSVKMVLHCICALPFLYPQKLTSLAQVPLHTRFYLQIGSKVL